MSHADDWEQELLAAGVPRAKVWFESWHVGEYCGFRRGYEEGWFAAIRYLAANPNTYPEPRARDGIGHFVKKAE